MCRPGLQIDKLKEKLLAPVIPVVLPVAAGPVSSTPVSGMPVSGADQQTGIHLPPTLS